MLKILTFFTTLLCFYQASANSDTGFTRGSLFQAVAIQGEIRVECDGFNGTGNAVYTCRNVVLDPSGYDHFKGPIEPGLDRLELTASHEDGSSRSVMVDYAGASGMTREPVNLWISGLFQKPLLEKGRNKVRYRTTHTKNIFETMASGEITVEVKKGTARTCPTANLQSSDINDCHSQFSICERYFQENNNCL